MNAREAIEVPGKSYDANTILSIDQVAEWLGVGTRTVERMDIPCIMIGPRTKRYLASLVVQYLEKKARVEDKDAA